MIRLLKFAAFLCVLLAVASAVWIGMYALTFKPAEHPATLKKSPIELARENKVENGQQDAVSPLVSQARQFKLKIDPPEPPQPERRDPAPERPIAGQPVTPTIKPEIPDRLPDARANFKLVGTCRYIDKPEKSLALIDLPANGQKWVRLGETVMHHVIAEIGDDMIVLDQNGRRTSMYAPKKQTVSLLKNPEPEPTSSVTAKAANLSPSDSSTQPTVPSPAAVRPGADRMPNGRVARRPTPKRAPIPTPEERKASLDKNISDIQSLMKSSSEYATTPEEKKQEMQTWTLLLQLLQADRNNLADQTKKDDAETKEKAQPASGQNN